MNKLIFIDTANVDDIKTWMKRGCVDGVTTNQRLLLKEKNISLENYKKYITGICSLGKFPVSLELTGHDSVDKMVKEAKLYSSWHKNIVIKVPMTTDGMGLEVVVRLDQLDIKTNATLMVSYEQMLLSIKAQATYASFFFNRAKEAGYDPEKIIQRTRSFIDAGRYKTLIIAGSIRSVRDVGDAFNAGCDIVTIPPQVLQQMIAEQRTEETVAQFDNAWQEFKKR